MAVVSSKLRLGYLTEARISGSRHSDQEKGKTKVAVSSIYLELYHQKMA